MEIYSENALATRDNLPKYSREYYIAIVKNHPERLEEILDGFGWSRTELFMRAEAIYSAEKFDNMDSEEKAATLLWYMDDRFKEEVKPVQSQVRQLLESFLPQSWVDEIMERNRQRY